MGIYPGEGWFIYFPLVFAGDHGWAGMTEQQEL